MTDDLASARAAGPATAESCPSCGTGIEFAWYVLCPRCGADLRSAGGTGLPPPPVVRTAPRVRTPTAPGATKSIVVGVVSLFAMFTSRLFLYLVGRSLIGTSPSGFSAPGMGMFQALVVLAAFGPVAGSVAAIVIGRRASKAAAAGSRGFVRAQLGAAVGWIGVAIFVLGFFFSPLM